MVEGLRRQYHFMPEPDGDGRRAWDVHGLIELSAELPVEQIAVESVAELDMVHWYDEHTQPTVRNVIEHLALVEAADLSYPIILGADGRVMDGMHRVAKALLEGRTMLPAVRFPVDPPPDHRHCHPADLPYD